MNDSHAEDQEAEHIRELLVNLRDAMRYRRLRLLGCAPDGTDLVRRGLVLRFTNLDEYVDADISAHPERGDLP